MPEERTHIASLPQRCQEQKQIEEKVRTLANADGAVDTNAVKSCDHSPITFEVMVDKKPLLMEL